MTALRSVSTFRECLEAFLSVKEKDLSVLRGRNPVLTLKSYRHHLERFLAWLAFNKAFPKLDFRMSEERSSVLLSWGGWIRS